MFSANCLSRNWRGLILMHSMNSSFHKPLLHPQRGLPERGFDDPVADFDDLPGRLEHIQKLDRCSDSVFGMIPADQGFGADDLPRSLLTSGW